MNIYIVSDITKTLKGEDEEVVLVEFVHGAYFSKPTAIKNAKKLKNGVVDVIKIKDDKEFFKKMAASATDKTKKPIKTETKTETKPAPKKPVDKTKRRKAKTNQK